jgi:transposase
MSDGNGTMPMVLTLAKAGLRYRDIATRTGVPMSTVGMWIRRELGARGRRRISDETRQWVVALGADGLEYAEISQRTGVSATQVGQILRAVYGIRKRQPPRERKDMMDGALDVKCVQCTSHHLLFQTDGEGHLVEWCTDCRTTRLIDRSRDAGR